MKLEDAKELQIYLKQIWTKYQKEDLNQKSKKVHWQILNCFTSHGKLLLNYLMIILQSHLKLNTKYEEDLKILTIK